MKTLTFGGDLLLTLLLHVGAAASICAWLARSATFRKVLFTELRDSDQKLKLMLFVTPPLAFGVILRIVGHPYRAADLMLEGSFLLGLARRARCWAAGRIDHQPACVFASRMAVHARCRDGRTRGRADSPDAAEHGRDLEARAVYVSEHAALAGAVFRGKKVTWEMLPLGGLPGAGAGRSALGHATKPQWLFYMDAGNAGPSRWSCCRR